jgi:hypothetical protein
MGLSKKTFEERYKDRLEFNRTRGKNKTGYKKSKAGKIRKPLPVKPRTGENWLPYPLREDYLISDHGRVIGPSGHLLRLTERGPYFIFSVRIDGMQHSIPMHIAVLETFVGPRPEGMEARHKNDIGTDNRLCNLCWGTSQDNKRDLFKNRIGKGLPPFPVCRLSATDIRQIKERHLAGYRPAEIAKHLKIPASRVQNIIRRKSWELIEDDQN